MLLRALPLIIFMALWVAFAVFIHVFNGGTILFGGL